ncbi:hypothetical protein AAEU32_08840 [Pseudoalteromonas sp. SSDWG2]|uniref:hypothetical protein n=1 Tax=Pseudoalteromonas sp. SSDWG2 TaxID=3139391 RepID=UPI003BAA9B08
MSEQFKLFFAHLDDNQDQETASQALQQKLKLSDKQINAFFAGQSIFPASTQDKALKQAKVLANLGIRCRLKRLSSASSAPVNNKRDEQIMAALDYITSSLIRIEERLDDMDHRFSEQLHQSADDLNDDLALDLNLDEESTDDIKPIYKRWPMLVMVLLIVLLLSTLALQFFYPDLLPF